MDSRGFFLIGVYRPKAEVNVGTLWRHAFLFGAVGCFTVGLRYRHQTSDTLKTTRHIPLTHYADIDDLIKHLPNDCPLVAVELCDKAKPLDSFNHEERCCYLLGAEDDGLPIEVLARAHRHVVIPSPMERSMNVAVAGSIVMYDRYVKSKPTRKRFFTPVRESGCARRLFGALYISA